MNRLHYIQLFYLFAISNILFFGHPITTNAQTNLTFLGNLDYSQNVNDIWGYVDNNGREYALIGTQTGTAIIDLSNSANPTEVAFVNGISNSWRDLKVWGNYAYVITEAQEGLLIIDLSNLPNSIATFTSDLGVGYTDSHNIFIDEFGVAYLFGASSTGVGRGTLMVNVAANSTNPTYLGIYAEQSNGVNHYIHDGYVRNNVLWGSEIYYGHVTAINVSNKNSPTILGVQATPGDFTHACWLSDNSQTVFTVDEVNGAFVMAYDVSDVTDMKELDRFQMFPGSNTAPHNIFVKNDFIVLSYYTAGVVILDAARPDNLILVGHYDTSTSFGAGFSGCWGVYPYLPSGRIIASDRQNGLFVLNPNYVRACYLEGKVTDEDTGQAILGAQVEILNGSEPISTTDFLGDYKMGTRSTGTYTVRASATGYITEDVPVTWAANGTLRLTNIALGKTPTCAAPVNLMSANVTQNSATINWNVEDDAIQYHLYYKISSAATWQTITVSNNTFNLTNLMSGTSYSVYVEADCGSGFVSSPSNTITFTTIVVCAIPTNIAVSTIMGNSASVSWSGSNPALSYVVRYRVVGTASWTTINLTATSLSLQNLMEETNYEVEVQANCGTNNSSAFSDPTYFMTTSNCIPPNNISINNVVNNSGQVNWDAVVNAQNYTVRYRLLSNGGGAGLWEIIAVGGATSYALGNLAADSDYELQIQADCGSSNSDFSDSQFFSTLADCVVPTNITTSNVSPSQFTLHWEEQTVASAYNILYRIVGEAWQMLQTTENAITLSNLESCVTYEYQIQSDCNTYVGDFSTLATVTTPCVVNLQLKVFLEGSYEGGQLMTTRLTNLVPNTQPYNTAPWNYNGTETTPIPKSGITDWIVVELRSADQSKQLIARQAVALLPSGHIRTTQNSSTITFTGISPNDYYIVVRHRNHIDVISKNPIRLGGQATLYDFTTGAHKVMGEQQMKFVGDAYVLWSGDMDGNGLINVEDFNAFVRVSGGIGAYQDCDLNLDRNVTTIDFNVYTLNSSRIGVAAIRY